MTQKREAQLRLEVLKNKVWDEHVAYVKTNREYDALQNIIKTIDNEIKKLK